MRSPLIALLSVLVATLAAGTATTATRAGKPYFESTEVVTKRSTVLAIDKAKR